MATCAHCGSTIVFGGRTANGMRYCNDSCMQAGLGQLQQDPVFRLAAQLPPETVQAALIETHSGTCPRCQGAGPVDVHESHRVWSALVMTQWVSRQHVCCKSCANKAQLTDIAFCTFLGWWGFPWGILMTPIQVVRNICCMASGPNPMKPSEELERIVRLHVASNLWAQHQQEEQRKPRQGLNPG